MANYETHLVVFDGTSAYVIPKSDYDEMEEQIIAETDDFDYACELMDKENREIEGNPYYRF